MLKHKTPSSFSGLATARAEINPTRALPVIARAWLRHWTQIMTTSNWNSFEIDGEEIEVVSSFMFLGSEVEEEGRCDKEIKRRVAIGKATMIGLEKLWQDKHVSIDTKKDSENINFSDSSVWL